MASQPLEEPSSKMASGLVGQIDRLLNRVHPSQLTAIMDLAAALPVDKQYGKNAQKTSQKLVIIITALPVSLLIMTCVGLSKLESF